MEHQPGPQADIDPTLPRTTEEAGYTQSIKHARSDAFEVNEMLKHEGPPQPGFGGEATHKDNVLLASDIVQAKRERNAASPSMLRAAADKIDPTLNAERREAERAKMTDSLTGLANQAAFEKARESADLDEHVAVGFLDGNNFGIINKTEGLGHAAGNAAIIAAADALRAASTDYPHIRLFRVGGDEFAILGSSSEVADVLKDTSRLFDERLLASEPLDDGHGAKFDTHLFRDEYVSLPGVMGSTFAEADAKLQAAKAARKAIDGANKPDS